MKNIPSNITITLFLQALLIFMALSFHLCPASVVYARDVDEGINDTEGT